MSLPTIKRSTRILGIFTIFLVAMLLISCSVQSTGSTHSVPEGGEHGGAGDGSEDPSESDQSEDVEFDVVNLSSFPCPE